MNRTTLPRLSLAVFVIGLACCHGSEPAVPRTVQFVRAAGQSGEYFGFNAHQSESGEVTGSVVSRSVPDSPSPWAVEGRVTCLRVVGNRASIGGDLQRFFYEDWSDPAQYHGWYMFVEDNRDQTGVPDRISENIYISNEPMKTCPNPTAGSANEDVTDGDVVVTEGVATGSR